MELVGISRKNKIKKKGSLAKNEPVRTDWQGDTSIVMLR